jgi:hypothetical protein
MKAALGIPSEQLEEDDNGKNASGAGGKSGSGV